MTMITIVTGILVMRQINKRHGVANVISGLAYRSIRKVWFLFRMISFSITLYVFSVKTFFVSYIKPHVLDLYKIIAHKLLTSCYDLNCHFRSLQTLTQYYSICRRLFCYNPHIGRCWTTSEQRAALGTPCEDNKVLQ